jgi:hypothetical protein
LIAVVDTQPGEINHWDGGRGVYFDDPNDHLLEILTRPYGRAWLTASHPHPLLKGKRQASPGRACHHRR